MMGTSAGSSAAALLCVLLGQLLAPASAALEPSATLSPLLLTASLNNGNASVFQCEVTGATRADVTIDGIAFDNEQIRNRGIDVESRTIDAASGIIQSTITVPASYENNETSIQCISLNFTSLSIVHSSVATFLVQGLLEAPSIEFVTINDSHLAFVWEAPFTLDITDADPDIQFYILQENLTNSIVNVTEPGDFLFPNLAVPIIFSVSAWNVVGPGEIASATHQPCLLTAEQHAVDAAGVRSEVSFQEDLTPSLSLSLDWTTSCVPLFSVQLVAEGAGGEWSHSGLVPSVSGSGEDWELELSVSLLGLPLNTRYTAQLTSVSQQGEMPATGTLSFSTHDVQGVRIDFTATTVLTTCHFAVGSQALGCSVHISDQSGLEVRVGMAMRDDGSNEEGLPLSTAVMEEGLASGVYTVRVYDIESSGEVITTGTPAHTQTVNTTQPTAPPVTTDSPPVTVITDPLGPGEENSGNVVPIIAGAIVGGVLLVAVAVLVLFSALLCAVRRKRRHKFERGESRENEFVLIATGTAISSDNMSSAHLSPAHTLQASTSSSPAHTLQASTSSSPPRQGSTSSLHTAPTKNMAPPPTYSQIIGNKHSHSLSDPSNDNTADGQRWGSNAGEGRREGSLVLSQESQVHLLSDTDSAQGTLDSIRYTGSLRKAVEATLSAPSPASTSPPPSNAQPPPPPQDMAPQYTAYSNLQRHLRSSSLGGRPPVPSHISFPNRTGSFSPQSTHLPHPNLASSHRNTISPSHPLHSHLSTRPPSPPHKRGYVGRGQPTPSYSNPSLLPPPPSSTPPPPLPPNTLTYQDIKSLPSGSDVLGGVSRDPNQAANPLYDTAGALQPMKDEKRRSIHYTEVYTHQPPPPPTEIVPRDKNAVLYSELNMGELAPRLPGKRSQL